MPSRKRTPVEYHGATSEELERVIKEVTGFAWCSGVTIGPSLPAALMTVRVGPSRSSHRKLAPSEKRKILNRFRKPKKKEYPHLSVLIHPGTAPQTEIENLLKEINELYKLVGGSGITWKRVDTGPESPTK